MELSNEIVKKGTSTVKGLLLEYSVKYAGDKATAATAVVKRAESASGARNKWIAALSFDGRRMTFSVFDVKVMTAEERAAVYSDFEESLKTLEL